MNQHFIKWLNLTTTLQKTEDREHSEQSWMVERPFNNKEQMSWANRVPGSSNNDRERDFRHVSTRFHLIHDQPSIFQMQKPQVQTASLTMPFFFFLSLLPFCFVLAMQLDMGDLSSPTRDGTRVPCAGSLESSPLDRWESPMPFYGRDLGI